MASLQIVTLRQIDLEGLAYFQARVGKRMLEIFGPSLAKPKIRAAKEKCAGDTQYRRAYFNVGCVDFGESGDVENLFNTLQDSPTSHKVTPSHYRHCSRAMI